MLAEKQHLRSLPTEHFGLRKPVSACRLGWMRHRASRLLLGAPGSWCCSRSSGSVQRVGVPAGRGAGGNTNSHERPGRSSISNNTWKCWNTSPVRYADRNRWRSGECKTCELPPAVGVNEPARRTPGGNANHDRAHPRGSRVLKVAVLNRKHRFEAFPDSELRPRLECARLVWGLLCGVKRCIGTAQPQRLRHRGLQLGWLLVGERDGKIRLLGLAITLPPARCRPDRPTGRGLTSTEPKPHAGAAVADGTDRDR